MKWIEKVFPRRSSCMDPTLLNCFSTPGCQCLSLSAKMVLYVPKSTCDTEFPRRLFLCSSWKFPPSLLMPNLYVSTSWCAGNDAQCL